MTMNTVLHQILRKNEHFEVKVIEVKKGYTTVEIMKNTVNPQTVGNKVDLANWILASYAKVIK